MTLFDVDEPDDAGEGGGRPEPEPSGPTERIRLVVAYDGEPFHGFAVNAGVPTVAGALGDALALVTGHRAELTCAGRTDKGVHARSQVVHLDLPAGSVDLAALVRSVNKLCAPSIAVRRAEVVDPTFDARFSATARRYRYLVRNAPVPEPATARAAWHVDVPLSLPAMVLACDGLIGEHDFSSFCRRPKRRDGEEASLVRRVTEAVWHDDGGGSLRFEIEASSFCHQMVRSVVGTLVDVGRGRRRPGEVLGIVRARDRRFAGELAPAHGLTLWTVRYPGWSTDEVEDGFALG